jgi:hypothetical protein
MACISKQYQSAISLAQYYIPNTTACMSVNDAPERLLDMQAQRRSGTGAAYCGAGGETMKLANRAATALSLGSRFFVLATPSFCGVLHRSLTT